MPTTGSGNLTDLTNTTWYFDHMPVTISELIVTYHIDFISNEESFTAFSLVGSTYNQIVYGSPDVSPCPSPDYIWTNSEYATIYITGGTDATNTTLITWLYNNATFIQHDIEIKYNNLVITSLDDSGTKTLLTAGKYCQDNITIQYSRYSPEVYDGEHHQPAPGFVTVMVVVLNSEYVTCDVYNYNNEIGQHLGSIIVPGQSVVVQPETDEIYIRFTGVSNNAMYSSYVAAGGEATLVNITLSGNTAGFRFSINGDVTIIMSGVR